MNEDGKIKYKKLLLEIKDRLLDDLGIEKKDELKKSPEESASDLSKYPFHQADDATQTYTHEFNLAILSNKDELLNEVDFALKKLDSGRYGICELCQSPISSERLDAVPWTRFDKECAEKYERDHPHRPADFKVLEDDQNGAGTMKSSVQSSL